MAILEARNVSIRYITGDFKDIGLKEYVMRRLTGNYHVTEFWADKDVSFTLEHGEMLGIIGSNGAGKSTLLKAVSGIMVPTEGWIRREGTIAALLELASGFDGELTVKENAYLRGAMLGYTRKFMDEKYDEIIDFAELKDFEDRPFKQLSSGMKSRLAVRRGGARGSPRAGIGRREPSRPYRVPETSLRKPVRASPPPTPRTSLP